MTPFEIGMLVIAGLTLIVNVARMFFDHRNDDDDKDVGRKE